MCRRERLQGPWPAAGTQGSVESWLLLPTSWDFTPEQSFPAHTRSGHDNQGAAPGATRGADAAAQTCLRPHAPCAPAFLTTPPSTCTEFRMSSTSRDKSESTCRSTEHWTPREVLPGQGEGPAQATVTAPGSLQQGLHAASRHRAGACECAIWCFCRRQKSCDRGLARPTNPKCSPSPTPHPREHLPAPAPDTFPGLTGPCEWGAPCFSSARG